MTMCAIAVRAIAVRAYAIRAIAVRAIAIRAIAEMRRVGIIRFDGSGKLIIEHHLVIS